MSETASADVPTPADTVPDTANARAEAAARELIAHIKGLMLALYHFGRGVLFVLYLVLAVISFWFWIATVLGGVFQTLLRAVMLFVLWLSGGMPPREPVSTIPAAIERDVKRLWAQRLVAYEAFSRPAARHYLRLERSLVTFWHWHFFRKVTAVIFGFFFVFVPAMYIVPRPHYVQITDDNAINYDGKDVSYQVHGLDLFEPAVHREYVNEDAWWLGKINSQGLKSQLQIGKNYRLWVIGIRWYYAPKLYPNIIGATEVDDNGVTIAAPTKRIAR